MNESRIKAYKVHALTAGGTAVMAAFGVAQADIIMSDGSVSIPVPLTGASSGVTLFSTAGIEIVASNFASWSTAGDFSAAVLVKARAGSSLVSNVLFTDVNAGMTIDADLASASEATGAALNLIQGTSQSTSKSGYIGGFATGSERLLALNIIEDGSGSHYGWINYTLSYLEGGFTLTINSWAYNNVMNEGIIAGQDQAASSNAVPGLGGLAALAIGAAGVRSRRQRVS